MFRLGPSDPSHHPNKCGSTTSCATSCRRSFPRLSLLPAQSKKLSDADSKRREDLEARSSLIADLSADTALEDIGPLIEAVVWHDGSVWRSALDTTDFFAYGVATPAGEKEARGSAICPDVNRVRLRDDT